MGVVGFWFLCYFVEGCFGCVADGAFVGCFAFDGVAADAADVDVGFGHVGFVFHGFGGFLEQFRVDLFDFVCDVKAPFGFFDVFFFCGGDEAGVHFHEFVGFAGDCCVEVFCGGFYCACSS